MKALAVADLGGALAARARLHVFSRQIIDLDMLIFGQQKQNSYTPPYNNPGSATGW